MSEGRAARAARVSDPGSGPPGAQPPGGLMVKPPLCPGIWDHFNGEDRFISIGFLDDAMVVLVWTPRDDACRIISMRKANERERRLYGPRS